MVGEWTEPGSATSSHPPLTPTLSLSEKDGFNGMSSNETKEKEKKFDKKKSERISRMLTTDGHGHAKLSKKVKVRFGNHSLKPIDK